ncbi:helix-turn-helix domain-containing protein [Pseudooceanicola sp. MF1-13]|uniref:helix-turn-helix domain-containing protein n=1 Tax=Pseudooceanicola sp. MF1-13 TaxID=3379095 RepID=UPI00389244A7
MSDVIDGNWILRRLTDARGEKARIARAMGIDQQKLSKILTGKRQVQPNEMPGLLEYFGVPLPDSSTATPIVSRISPATPALTDLAAYLAPGRNRTESFLVQRELMAFGLLRNDVIVVDLAQVTPSTGDLVLVDRTSRSGNITPARFVGGHLVYADPTLPPEPIDQSLCIVGVIVGSARAPSLIQATPA